MHFYLPMPLLKLWYERSWITIYSIIKNRKNESKDTFTAFVDYTKCFDLIDRNVLYFKLIQYGIDGKMYRTLKRMYSNTMSCANLKMYWDLNYPLERGQEPLIREVRPWWLPFSQVSSSEHFFVSHNNKMQCESVQSPTDNRKSSKYIFKWQFLWMVLHH